jgi:hypothetical protein
MPMNSRFSEWIALQASAEATMVSMATFGASIVLIWFALRLWPASMQKAMCAGVLVIGGLSYVASFIFAIWVLVVGGIRG